MQSSFNIEDGASTGDPGTNTLRGTEPLSSSSSQGSIDPRSVYAGVQSSCMPFVAYTKEWMMAKYNPYVAEIWLVLTSHPGHEAASKIWAVGLHNDAQWVKLGGQQAEEMPDFVWDKFIEHLLEVTPSELPRSFARALQYHTLLATNRLYPRPGPVSGTDVFETEGIVGQKEVDGETVYKVRWTGWPDWYDTWEPEANVDDLLRNSGKHRAATPE